MPEHQPLAASRRDSPSILFLFSFSPDHRMCRKAVTGSQSGLMKKGKRRGTYIPVSGFTNNVAVDHNAHCLDSRLENAKPPRSGLSKTAARIPFLSLLIFWYHPGHRLRD